MKIKKAHFIALRNAINTLLERNPDAIDNYRNGRFPLSHKVKDLNKRFRWDCFHAAAKEGKVNIGDIYRTCNDLHIDTALRRIVPNIV